MANLEDLGYTSILDMNNDEAIDLLRQIRLSRRIPEKRTTTITKVKQTKAKATAELSPEMAAALLEIIGGRK